MKDNKTRWLYIILSLFILTGCTGKGIHIVDVRYDTARQTPPVFSGKKAVLIPLEDVRKETGIGKWEKLFGDIDTVVTSKPVYEATSFALLEYLKKSGLDVSMTSRGVTPEEFMTIPPHFVIGGSIEQLKIDAASYTGWTQVKSSVRLKISITNVKEGSKFAIVIRSVSEPKAVVLFDQKVFEKTLNDALSDGFERIPASVSLEGEVLKPKTK